MQAMYKLNQMKNALLIILIFSINLCFAQTNVKPPPSPFSFDSGSLTKNDVPLMNKPFLLAPPNQVINQNYGPPQTIIKQPNTLQNFNTINNQSLANNSNNENPLRLDNISDELEKIFETKFSIYSEKLIPYVLRLLYAISVLAIVFNGIMHLMRGSDLKLFVIDAGTIVSVTAIYQLIIKNWAEISAWLINYFKNIGTSVSDYDLTYSDILDAMTQYFSNIFNSLALTEIAQSLCYLFFACTTLIITYKIVSIYIYCFFETIIISKISIIYLGFGSFFASEGFARKPIKYCISAGIKMMFLHLFFGAIISIILDFAKKPISLELAITMLLVIVIIHHIVHNLVNLVDSFIHQMPGTPQRAALAQSVKAGVMDSFKAIQAARNLQKTAAAALSAAKIRNQSMMMNPLQLALNTAGSSNFNGGGFSSGKNLDGYSQNSQDNSNQSSQSSSKNNIQANNQNSTNAKEGLGYSQIQNNSLNNLNTNASNNSNLETNSQNSNNPNSLGNSNFSNKNSIAANEIANNSSLNNAFNGYKNTDFKQSQSKFNSGMQEAKKSANIALQTASNILSAATKGDLSSTNMRKAAENKLQRESFNFQQRKIDSLNNLQAFENKEHKNMLSNFIKANPDFNKNISTKNIQNSKILESSGKENNNV